MLVEKRADSFGNLWHIEVAMTRAFCGDQRGIYAGFL
jgi:hypothetical protein